MSAELGYLARELDLSDEQLLQRLLGLLGLALIGDAAAAGEAQMKTSRDPRLVFERWIVKVCG